MVFWDVTLCGVVNTLLMAAACSSETDVSSYQNTAITVAACNRAEGASNLDRTHTSMTEVSCCFPLVRREKFQSNVLN
jgi:hypothetical protein